MTSSHDLPVLLERLARVLQNDAHTGGLKPVQWEALRYLARANRFSRTPSALTAYLGTTKGTVSQTLGALERKGLVAKETDPADRRQIHLVLTEAGASLLDDDPIQAILQSTAALSEPDGAGVAQGLQTVLTETLRRRGGHPFGACRTCRFFRADHPDGAPHRCALLDAPLSAGDRDKICVEQEAAE